MTEAVTKVNATDFITVVEGYDAMRIFLKTALQRLGKTDKEMALIVAGLKWADGAPVDPTMLEVWLEAVQIACIGRTDQVVKS